MRAIEFLCESLKQIYDISVTQDTKDDYTASFRTENGIKYIITIKEIDDDVVEVEFIAYGKAISDKHLDSSGVTNTGDAFRVFATVIAVIKDYIKKYNPSVIEFTAREPSRVKLYRKLVQKLSSDTGTRYVGAEENLGSQIAFTLSSVDNT